MTAPVQSRDVRRIDRYNRISMYGLVLLEPLAVLFLMFPPAMPEISAGVPRGVTVGIAGVAIVHTAACFLLLRAGLRHRVDGRPAPHAMRAIAGAVTVVGVGVLQLLRDDMAPIGTTGWRPSVLGILALLFFYGATLAAGMSARNGWRVGLAGSVLFITVALAGGHASTAPPAPYMLVFWSLLAVVFGSTFPTFVWISRVLWELERARDAQARLAVAEERLRFSRDLHDVLGRNLSVVALQSELAAKLATRGETEQAAVQMENVRTMAEESMGELRDVVRGYRAADLDTELAGSRSMLEAAGIRCVVSGSAAGLPEPVQAALAWVVREGTTNILRHSDATSCTLTLDQDESEVTLTMVNDGSRADDPGGSGSRGTGLVGLAERMAAEGGTFTAAPEGRGRFRVTASVPLRKAVHA